MLAGGSKNYPQKVCVCVEGGGGGEDHRSQCSGVFPHVPIGAQLLGGERISRCSQRSPSWRRGRRYVRRFPRGANQYKYVCDLQLRFRIFTKYKEFRRLGRATCEMKTLPKLKWWTIIGHRLSAMTNTAVDSVLE